MDLREIVDSIYYGLTGHNETDIKYLMDMAEKYRDHELGKEIAEECGRMIAERVSPEQMEEIRRAMDRESRAYGEIIKDVNEKCREGRFDEALEIIEPQIAALESRSEKGVISFEEPFDELLYKELYSDDAEATTIPYAVFYSLYGSILIDLEREDEAEKALERAVGYNPVSASALFEYTELFKKRGDIDRYEELTKKAFTISYRPRNLARCYRNMGYVFIERELYREAVACYMLSMRYDRESKTANNELYYIEKVTGKKISGLTYEEVESMSKKYGFPLGADETIVGIAYNAGMYFYNEMQYGEAVYFLEITYGITGSEEIAKLLENISEIITTDSQEDLS